MAWPGETLDHWPSDGSQKRSSERLLLNSSESDIKGRRNDLHTLPLASLFATNGDFSDSVQCHIKRPSPETHNGVISLASSFSSKGRICH